MMVIHVVKKGDTISSIADEYGVNMADIIRDNEILYQSDLVIGQTLLILFRKVVHDVKEGETLSSIAQQYNTTENQILRNNLFLEGSKEVFLGDQLIIEFESSKLGDMSMNGYAYLDINRDLLKQTLPYMTYFSPFTYGFTEEGELIELDDEGVLNLAKNYGVKPLLHLSSLTEEGKFSNQLASSLLNNEATQDVLISNILRVMEEKGYSGLDIDFEFVLPEDKDKYTAFVEKLKNSLNPMGYEVMVALVPKVSADQKGEFYEGHDYKGLAEAANDVLLMTYEWGYTYGPPLAVAPIPSVKRVLDYAITEMPPEKIFMGMPNYGYDWTLPYVKGESKANLIGNTEAVDIARRNKAEILFDDFAMAPYFYYTDNQGKQHVVWFEDARSIKAKAELANQYGFKGLGYWNMMRPFPQNWQLINNMFNIRQ